MGLEFKDPSLVWPSRTSPVLVRSALRCSTATVSGAFLFSSMAGSVPSSGSLRHEPGLVNPRLEWRLGLVGWSRAFPPSWVVRSRGIRLLTGRRRVPRILRQGLPQTLADWLVQRDSAARKRSASIAAAQPIPAAVTA